ncbi:hypothetical protein ACHAQH_002952 [Verticillium albo-atrum]
MPPAFHKSPVSELADNEMSGTLEEALDEAQNEASAEQFEPLVVSDIDTLVPSVVPAHPVKRGPGRPSKKSKAATAKTAKLKEATSKIAADTNLKGVDNEAPSPTKNGPGHVAAKRRISTPPFFADATDDERAESDNAVEDSTDDSIDKPLDVVELSPVKRGRGRPKKMVPSRPIGQRRSRVDEESDDESGEHRSVEHQLKIESFTPIKRGPGRPPKKRQSSNSIVKTPVKKQCIGSSTDASEPRRSSRVRSSGGGSCPVVKASPAAFTTSQAVHSKAEKRRGRPPKFKTPAKAPKYGDKDTEKEWEVESIEDSLIDRQGGVHYYQVKWKSYPASQNTWEPRASLDKCQELITAFQERSKKTRKSRK